MGLQSGMAAQPPPDPVAARWRRVEEICDAALGLSGSEREACLVAACGGDPTLRREVESLLAHEQSANGFLSVPERSAAAWVLAEQGRDLTGTRLGAYEIVAKLGEGGMGVVYRARDSRLDRDVALKLVTHRTSGDDFARLRGEARAAARLNHPNICTVFEVAIADGVAGIAMEWVEGATLSAAIPNGGWPSDRVCRVGRQIADALAHAHANGVTHRDLKSSNVMIRPEGRVKVIDFGIADRVVRPIDQTETERPMWSGLAGTLSYLAPELLNGAPPDARSDLWSLGVLLYEMAAGRLPFVGSGAPKLAAAILRDPPPRLPSSVTPELSKVIDQCLAKEPSDRPASAAEVAAALEKHGARPVDVRKRSMGTPALAGALALAITAMGAYLSWPNAQVPLDPLRFGNPKPVTTALGVEEFAAWSPDGRTLAYTASATGHIVDRWDIWVTQLAGGTPINRTAGFGQRNLFPSWSPNGALISFWSDQDGGGCYVMPALGGSPRRIAPTTPFDPNPAEWSDGARLTCVTGTLEQPVLTAVSLETGAESRRIPLPGTGQRRMFVTGSPDGTRLALVTASAGLDADVAQLWVYEISTATLIPVTDGRTKAWSPFWSRDGRSLYYVDVSGASMDLWEQPFTAAGRIDGPPRTLTTGVGMRSATLSRDGTRLAYAVGRRVGNAYRVPYRSDRAATWSEVEQLTFDQASVQCMDLDRSGTRLALSSDRSGSFDLWTMPASGGNLTQVTSDRSAEWCPAWSPDGATLAFYAYRSGNRDVWTMPAPGGAWKQVTTNDGADLHPRWMPDGKSLSFLSNHGTTMGTFMSTLDGQPERQVDTAITGGRVSPMERLFATRGSDGRISIVDLDGRQARRSLTLRSETQPSWTADGRRLIVRSAPDRISVEDVAGGAARTLVDLSGRRGSLGIYGTPSDGKFVYFIWEENLGDIWTMDLVSSSERR